MTSLYRHILKKAWQITKKFSYLWPLGVFAALLGNGGEYQILLKQTELVANQPEKVSFWHYLLNLLAPNINLSNAEVLLLFFTFIITLIIIAIMLWVIISSLGGLIKGAELANQDEKSSYKKLFLAGSKKFWPVLGLNVIAKIIVYGFLIMVLGPLMIATFGQGKNAFNLLIVAISFLIFIPLSIIVSLVTKYAIIYVMLSGQKLREAFTNAWRLFNANWLVSLEMAFILFVINIAVGLGYIICAVLIFSPFFVLAVIKSATTPQSFNLLIYISITILLVFSAFVGAWLATFQTSSWTLLFIRLGQNEKAHSKIVRWFTRLPDKLKKNPTA